MANICEVSDLFVGSNKEIKKFKEILLNHFNNNDSIYDFAEMCDIKVCNIQNPDGIYARGEIVSDIDELYFGDENESAIRFYSHTAWAPLETLWNAILEKFKFYTIRYYYIAREFGNGLAIKHDPFNYLEEFDYHIYITTEKDNITLRKDIEEYIKTHENIFRKDLILVIEDYMEADEDITSEELEYFLKHIFCNSDNMILEELLAEFKNRIEEFELMGLYISINEYVDV